MPFSLDPPPAENEIECAHCGAHVPLVLNHCPECGINLYEPELRDESSEVYVPARPGPLTRLRDFIQGILGQPYRAEEVFGDALDQAGLNNDLLTKAGGDREVVERLIEFERQRAPNSTRWTWIHSAIQRWERDNRDNSPMQPD